MNQTRLDNICPPAHLRVILPSTMDNNMPPPFIDLNNMHDIPPPQADFSAPPPYDVAANSKLPTYEEVQREKQLEGEGPQPSEKRGPDGRAAIGTYAAQQPPPAARQPAPRVALAAEAEAGAARLEPEADLLGTDVAFLAAFLVAFLFNWVGFLLLMCFCRTVAGRYGALAGFGLSLAKWTLIVKHSTELASRENSWLWWLVMAFGALVCVRAVAQYLHIKRGWRLLSGPAQERLLFFY